MLVLNLSKNKSTTLAEVWLSYPKKVVFKIGSVLLCLF